MRTCGTRNAIATAVGLEIQMTQEVTEDVVLLATLFPEVLRRPRIFEGQQAQGPSPYAVVCNSVPKAGTYLLTEILKTTGQWNDIGYHCYTKGLNRVGEDGVLEPERKIPAMLWMEGMQSGTLCAAHVEYSPYIEQYLLASKRHKMLFITRDPRDLVISWVDFVYKSHAYAQMNATNRYLRKTFRLYYPTESDQIADTIENLPRSGLDRYVSWLSSPACHVVRFEDLYAELTDCSTAKSTLEAICDFLEIPRSHTSSFVHALGKGLTASERREKIGIYASRMGPENLTLLRDPRFQKLVLSFGYPETSVSLPGNPIIRFLREAQYALRRFRRLIRSAIARLSL
jgi:hypothetical protein